MIFLHSQKLSRSSILSRAGAVYCFFSITVPHHCCQQQQCLLGQALHTEMAQ